MPNYYGGVHNDTLTGSATPSSVAVVVVFAVASGTTVNVTVSMYFPLSAMPVKVIAASALTASVAQRQERRRRRESIASRSCHARQWNATD